jgi:hypothetical protein
MVIKSTGSEAYFANVCLMGTVTCDVFGFGWAVEIS